jgi:GntR family transcriptional regulator, vanillate catabolism transcriptional regulator
VSVVIVLHAMTSAAFTPDTQTERLVLALRERILQGQFPSGERLTELGLSSLLQVSRTPIRLALERLANEGLLDVIPTGGFRVHSFSLVDVGDAIEIRGVLEGTAVRFAAERLETAEELARVKQLVSKATLDIPVTVEGFARYLEVNKTFHRELWCLAKSPSLFRELEHICKIPFAAPDALVFTIADREQSTAFVAAEQHRAIVEAIENREGTRAEALAREHSRISRRNLEFAFGSKDSSDRLPGAALISNGLTNKEPT